MTARLNGIRSLLGKIPGVRSLALEALNRREIINYHLDVTKHRYLSSHRVEVDYEVPLIIGYIELGFGLGQYARGLAQSLEVSNVAFNIHPYRAFAGRRPQNFEWKHRYDLSGLHRINIYCMAPDQTKSARRLLRASKNDTTYNILSTFWELPRAPENWRGDLSFFDEVWTPNSFVASAFSDIFKGQVSIVPPCVSVGAIPSPARTSFGLSEEVFYFFFAFDFNSFAGRKNPMAVVEAFKMAFPACHDRVGLVIKTNGKAQNFPEIAKKLESSTSDLRIKVIHEDMSRDRLMCLFSSIDAYVSLHRSEGFGYGMVEAMLMKKPVIATGFSGNTDFLNELTGYPVPYRLLSVGESYPHGAGLEWADPEVASAAQILRRLISEPDEARGRARAALQLVLNRYTPVASGAIAARRLDEIRNIWLGEGASLSGA